MEVSLSEYLANTTDFDDGHCLFTLTIYPADAVRDSWESSTPLQFAYAVAGTFLAITIVFFIYDAMVRKRNRVIVRAAARSNKIVAKLFPDNVRDRLLAGDTLSQKEEPSAEQGTQTRLRNFLQDENPSAVDMEETDDLMFKTKVGNDWCTSISKDLFNNF